MASMHLRLLGRYILVEIRDWFFFCHEIAFAKLGGVFF